MAGWLTNVTTVTFTPHWRDGNVRSSVRRDPTPFDVTNHLPASRHADLFGGTAAPRGMAGPCGTVAFGWTACRAGFERFLFDRLAYVHRWGSAPVGERIRLQGARTGTRGRRPKVLK